MTANYQCLKDAFGAYLKGYFDRLVPDTKAIESFMARPFSTACVYAPARMIDEVSKMLDAWRKNNTSGTSKATPFLPVIIVAIAKDWTAAPPDWAPKQLADGVNVVIPGDPLKRVLDLTTQQREHRAQIVIIAQETQTANSLAAQLHLYFSRADKRTFQATYQLAGVAAQWPVMIETPDIIAPSMELGEDIRNLTVLAADFILRPTVPTVRGPRATEANDGQGAGTFTDPHGQAVVVENDVQDMTTMRRQRVTELYPDEPV